MSDSKSAAVLTDLDQRIAALLTEADRLCHPQMSVTERLAVEMAGALRITLQELEDAETAWTGALAKSENEAATLRLRLANLIRRLTGNEIIEQIAQAIFEHEGGCTREEDIQLRGKERSIWGLDGIQVPGEYDPSLAEWQRDDYRFQARAVRALLRKELGCDV